MDPDDKGERRVRAVDTHLWHVCAGGLLHMPPVNSKAFYFVQGHLEHANGSIDVKNHPRTPAYMLCLVQEIKYLADQNTDEVFAKIKLAPIHQEEADFADAGDVTTITGSKVVQQEEKKYFAKTLTQSDANNGGGFSVPRYCAEKIFPSLDYDEDPPVQNLEARDVHGKPWTFRHIYRGTPRRHLLTTGWSSFVNAKRLVAGDSIVFLKADNGDLCVGLRRARRVVGGTIESSSGWTPSAALMQYTALSSFIREDEQRMMKNSRGFNSSVFKSGSGKVKVESVVEAAIRAAKGLPFEVVYYPRAGTPEFVVKAADVKAAVCRLWCAGTRIEMPCETEDGTRVTCLKGTVSSVQAVDPVLWGDSPWRLLQVTWDEPDLPHNVRHVSPWLVKSISDMPDVNMPRKKLRIASHPDFPMDGQLPLPTGPSDLHGASNPFGYLPKNSPAGMQGARHTQFGVIVPDFHKNQLLLDLFPSVFHPAATWPKTPLNYVNVQNHRSSSEDISCPLTVGDSGLKKSDEPRPNQIFLFGQPITITEEHPAGSWSGDTIPPNQTEKSSSEDKPANNSDGCGSTLNPIGQHVQEINFNLETGLCKVFMESENAGRDLNLSLMSSYGELCKKLAEMYGIEGSELLNRVVYRDAAGSAKAVGDEPFSEFVRRAKKLTIAIGLRQS